MSCRSSASLVPACERLHNTAQCLPGTSGILRIYSHLSGTSKDICMKHHRYLLITALLLTLPACDTSSNNNQTDGIKDALDARPHEEIRDAGEDVGAAVKDAGGEIKDTVKDAADDN